MATATADQIDRINRTISYIDDHLGEPLDLEDLAAIACFSKFHFHRVFTGVAGCSPQEYVKRRRLELAYHFLENDSSVSVHEMAGLLGFSSPSNFARSFRERYGRSPSQLHQPPPRGAGAPPPAPLSLVAPGLVRLEALEPFSVLYTRVRGLPDDPPRVERTFLAVQLECARRGWQLEGARQVVLGRSIPGLVAPERSLFDYGVEIPAGAAPHRADHVQTVKGGSYARYDYRGDPAGIVACWSELYSVWLKRSGLSVADGFGFTVNASERTQGAFQLYLPVQPARARPRRRAAARG